MGIIPASVHRLIDFAIVLAFALAPTLFGLAGNTRLLAYALAAIHLALTLVTHFPGRPRGLVQYHLHGIIEGVVGLALIALPLLRNWTHGARTFYLAIGVVLLIVAAISRQRPEPSPTVTP